MLELQAATVLDEMYCSLLRGQLANYEKKVDGKGKGKLMGDGLPQLLSGDEFYERVVEFAKEQECEKVAKESRQQARDSKAEAMKVWKKHEEERKLRNATATLRFREAVEEWKLRKEKAKEKGQRFSEKKPVRGKLEGPIPKPVLAILAGESGDEDGDDADGSDIEDEAN